MTDFAWTPGAGAYKHYPQYLNLTGNKLTVRGPEYCTGAHYHMGPTVSIELPDEVRSELSAALSAITPPNGDEVREALKAEIENWKRKTLAVATERDRLAESRERLLEALAWADAHDPQLVAQMYDRAALAKEKQ